MTSFASSAQAWGRLSSGTGSADPFTAFVAIQGSNQIATIATKSNTPGGVISLPTGTAPRHVAITPDNRTAYVADTGTNKVTPIDVATNTTLAPITVGPAPWGIAVTPDGKTVYVTASGGGAVTPIDVATNTAAHAITVGTAPLGIAITPDGTTAYVANNSSDTVTPITLATNTAGKAIAVGSGPYGVAITPDGKFAYVTNSGAGTVTPIDTTTNVAGATFSVGTFPEDIAVTPIAVPPRIYVANQGNASVSVINPSNRTTAEFSVPNSQPSGIAITPDGTQAYVSDIGNGRVYPVDISSGFGVVGTPISVGATPRGIAITKYQAGLATQATASVRPGGSISDTATLSNVLIPTGSVTFTLYGPNDPTCSGAPVFASTKAPTRGSPTATAVSDAFVPPAPGTYRWVASYSGDFSNSAVGPTACGATGEISTVSGSTAFPGVSVYRPSTGEWYFNSPPVAATFGGQPGDIPVPGEYDGDGKVDMAVYRPSVGTWYIHNSSSGTDTLLNYGVSTDLPVPAAYDGSGRTNIAVY
ncbi:MAG: YncE family protein, partial [Actinomycetota bacterium]|nr:YncE family protein [Actinomycetota bacterium]